MLPRSLAVIPEFVVEQPDGRRVIVDEEVVIDDQEHRLLDQRKRDVEDRDLASLAREIDERDRARRAGARDAEQMREGAFLPRNALMPDVNDPSIWGVRCKVKTSLRIPLLL
jgi:hypothetical protein